MEWLLKRSLLAVWIATSSLACHASVAERADGATTGGAAGDADQPTPESTAGEAQGGGPASDQGNTYSCLRAADAKCTQWDALPGASAASLMAACARTEGSGSGIFAAAACPSADRIGTCALQSSGETQLGAVTYSLYAPKNAAKEAADCATAGGVWTAE